MNQLKISATVDSLEDTNFNFLIISKFESLEKLYCYFDLMKRDVITSFSIMDSRKCYHLRIDVKNYYNSLNNELFLSEATVDILLKMIADVLLNQAFYGYHYDLTVDSKIKKTTEICFELL